MAVTKKNILITGGGTGGHISPGLALYEEFKKNGNKTFFLAGKRDLRFSSLNDIDSDDLFLYSAPSFTKNVLKLPVFIFSFFLSFLKARKIIKNKEIDAVIGMGGYVSGPALLSAVVMKKDIYLCEQNSVPGKVTGLFEKYAQKIFGTFEISRQYLKFPEKQVKAGNPIRKAVMKDMSVRESKDFFHLGHRKKIILVIGGSQGALKINELIAGMLEKYPEEFKDVGIIWSTGEFSYERFRKMMQENMDAGAIYLSPFIENVGAAYRACDIAISRSGAGVMMELAAMGIPSLQIPYPHAAMNHQDKNADSFVDAGAAIKISDKDALPEKVMPIISELLDNPGKLKKMSKRALSEAGTDAAEIIVKEVCK